MQYIVFFYITVFPCAHAHPPKLRIPSFGAGLCTYFEYSSVPFLTRHYNPKFLGFNAGLKVDKYYFLKKCVF